MRPSNRSDTLPRGRIQLTDHRIYLTWEDSSRRQEIPMFEDAENVRELPPPITPIDDEDFERSLRARQWRRRHGGSSHNRCHWVLTDTCCSFRGKAGLAMLSVTSTLL